VTALEHGLGGRLEARSLRSAHTVIHNTDRARDAVAADISIPGDHVAIRNGYDAADAVEPPDPECFRVLYSGHLYPFMDVRAVFAAFARLRERHALDAERLRIDFVGTGTSFNDVSLAGLARAYGLDDVFRPRARVGSLEIVRYQQAASVLVAFDWLFPIAVVSKFYEYARMRGALLLIGNREGALNDVAGKLGGRVLDPSDAEGIAAAVEDAYQRWRAGDFGHRNDRDGRFARSRQSEAIRVLLDALPEPNSHSGATDSVAATPSAAAVSS
jgi:glycosyltransferase involved in cell wall biosynthesis